MSAMIERIARALQRDDVARDHQQAGNPEDAEEADRIWDQELEPDLYKRFYYRQARIALEAIKDEGAVERVTRALWESDGGTWPIDDSGWQRDYERQARAAIAALLQEPPADQDAGPKERQEG